MVASRPLDRPESAGWPVDIPPGVALLVAGAPMTGKREVAYRLLADDRGPRGATVLVTTKKLGATVAGEYRSVHADQADGLLSVVDAVGEGADHARGNGDLRYARGPGDLTGIGIYASEAMDAYESRGDVTDVRVGLHTLSPMLMYADLEHVYRFLHVLVGRVRTAGHVGVLVVDEPHDSGRIGTLANLFDGVVEVRGADPREVRVRGTDLGPDEWTGF